MSKGPRTRNLVQEGQGSRLIGYTDSDWAGSEDDMRSTSGYLFTIGLGVFS